MFKGVGMCSPLDVKQDADVLAFRLLLLLVPERPNLIPF
jgi:hypothetical protein